MNRLMLRILLAGLLLGPPIGCSKLDFAAGPVKPVLANRGLERPHRVVSEFVERGRRVYVLWGLLPVGGENGEDLINRRLAQGDGIVNLTARERFSFIDNLIGLVTAGIISTRTLEVRGDVIAYTPPVPPPSPPPLP